MKITAVAVGIRSVGISPGAETRLSHPLRHGNNAAAPTLVPFESGQLRTCDGPIGARVTLLRSIDHRIDNDRSTRVHQGDRTGARRERNSKPLVWGRTSLIARFGGC